MTEPAKVAANGRANGSESLTIDAPAVDGDAGGLVGGMSVQVQTSTTSPSSDHDYDGLSDDVETSGWSNAAGSFTTDPLDPDSDDDGLTDGAEKLYDTNPRDDHSPGIYVEYEDHLMTRQYSAKDSHSEQPWGWQQVGDRLISLDPDPDDPEREASVVVRRGATFSVGGPADATIQVVKSLSYLTTLTPVRDTCNGRWRISIPTGGTVGKYEIILQEGDWNKSLNLYVIFELPTPTSSFTQAMIGAFLYDDDPADFRDETGILLNSQNMEYTHDDYPSRIPEGAWVNAGSLYGFTLQQFEPFVFEEHVIEAINGRNNQADAARDLVIHADEVTRFNNPRPLTSSWRVLHPGADDSQQCSNIAGILVAFERSAGIPSRPLLVDWAHRTFDSAAEIWLNGSWMAARSYTRLEPEECGWDCGYGYLLPRSRYSWGRYRYVPWHSGGSGSSSVIMAADENWGSGHAYRWPSWDWDAIARQSWLETLFAPYWAYYGWSQEPQVTGGAYSWPPIRDFTMSASPGSRTVSRENSTSYNVVLDTSNGFDNRVTLSVIDLPDGTTAGFEPSDRCTPDCSRTLVIETTSGTPIGTRTLTISTGESGGLVRETTVEIVVTDFSIDAAPGSRTVRAGDSTNYTVDLDPSDGFNDTVHMSVEGLPAGATPDFEYDNWGSPYNDNTLTIDTSTSTPAGDYTLTIRGTVGDLVRETTVQLSVTDFTIDASPGSRTVEQGDSTNYTVNLGPINGFDDAVVLDVMGLPANTTYSFNPSNPVPPTGSALQVNTTSSTPIVTRTLTIEGRSGELVHNTTVELRVIEPSGQANSGFSPGTSVAFIGEVSGGVASAGIPRGRHLFAPAPVAAPSTPLDAAGSPDPAGAERVANETLDDGPASLAVRGVGDYGVDLDGDGYFDQLVIEIEVDPNGAQPGTYWIQGDLGVDHYVPDLNWTGGIVASTVVRADLVEGTNTVQLTFDGLRISAAKVDGPYVMKYLSITDVDDPTPEDFANSSLGHWRSLYTTADYRAYDFQNRGAALSGEITERGLDSDGDARYESLILDVGLDIFEPGTYTVQGDLYDSLGKFVARATWTGTGSTASLQFDGLPGTVGPYTVEDVYLLNTDDEIIDSRGQAYTTQQVLEAEGRTHIVDQAAPGGFVIQGILPGTYSDYGLDLDDDGLYDLLAIDVQVEVEEGEAGQHRLEGWLAKDGSLISWASSEPISLTVGTHVISLTFSGPAISAHNTDGPFTLMALKLLEGEGYEVLDEVDVAYTTSAYTPDQFESLPYFDPTGHVIIFEDHMEDGEGNWTADSPWALITAESHSPTHSWTDSPGGNYANNRNVSLATVPITLSAFSRPTLHFQTCYALETGHDYGRVEISTNEGVTWTDVATYTGSTVHWSGETVDLGVIGGAETLQMRFRLETDVGITADGWYIDNVALYFDSDLDDDGIPNSVEAGEDPANPVDTDGDGTPNYLDKDSDDDGIPDGVEAGDDPANPVDTDGDGTPDYQDPDSDGDTIPDEIEAGDDPTNPVDTDGDGTPDYLDADSDNDSIPDSVEGSGDADGDGTPNYLDDDSDGDTIPDSVEGAGDTDGDGTPNYLDDDSDGDTIPDSVEGTGDADGDGIPNYLDNDDNDGPDADADGDTILNKDEDIAGREDADGDGIQNKADQDSDNDGIPDSVEAGDSDTSTPPVDTDGDGLPDFVDPDSDDDGIPDEIEAGDDPTDPVDTDGYGTPDYLDEDSDNDSIPDSEEGSGDTDGDGIPDFQDPDSDNDGIPDGDDPEPNVANYYIYLPLVGKD